MKPIYLSIRLPETGNHIKQLLKKSGYTVRDIQSAMGFENPQAIYKWMSGKTLPSLDNLVILSKILHSSMEDILVIDGDVVRNRGIRRRTGLAAAGSFHSFFTNFSKFRYINVYSG